MTKLKSHLIHLFSELFLLILLQVTLLFGQWSEIDVTKLSIGDDVKSSGITLMDQPEGFVKIINESTPTNSKIIVCVHGYQSRGYEWVAPLLYLAEKYSDVYFYRYDWNICPDSSAAQLIRSLTQLMQTIPDEESLTIFGHSYGGLVVTTLASSIDMDIPVEIHTIASPLAGYPRLTENCEYTLLENGQVSFLQGKTEIRHFQWRTQHNQDNAFNKMVVDPQNVELQGSLVIRLPATMNSHRLGHNWSITWVIRSYLGDEPDP